MSSLRVVNEPTNKAQKLIRTCCLRRVHSYCTALLFNRTPTVYLSYLLYRRLHQKAAITIPVLLFAELRGALPPSYSSVRGPSHRVLSGESIQLIRSKKSWPLCRFALWDPASAEFRIPPSLLYR